MTFEEFNRAMDFILQQQAEFSVKLDRDHEWAKSVIGQLAISNQRIVELIEGSTLRLDQNDREHRKFEETQRRSEEFRQETLTRLDQILERLTEQNQRPG